MALTPELREARERLVMEHAESENVHDFATTMATFHHPRYEIIPTGDVHDGEAAVDAYFQETRAAFPDQRNEVIRLHHADDAVVMELWLRGTHLGNYRGLPATGKSFECQVTAFFDFEPGTANLICERAYFDSNTILRQLGIAHDPMSLAGRFTTIATHPVTIGKAFGRKLLRR
jgi:steroid delta-isomerase-like uncharacterized protein